MQERERMHPADMAFLDDEQENDLVEKRVVSGKTKEVALWGLDQEFLGAASVLLQQMNQEPNGPKSRAAIRLALEKDMQAEVRARSTGDFMQLFLVSASDADIIALESTGSGRNSEKPEDYA